MLALGPIFAFGTSGSPWGVKLDYVGFPAACTGVYLQDAEGVYIGTDKASHCFYVWPLGFGHGAYRLQ